MTTTTMTVHPAANLFPLLEGEDFEALVQSIRMFGQQVPCVRDGDTIIDGRNRHRACQELGIETKWIEWRDVSKDRPFEYSGEGELLASDYIWSLNFDRRHLTDDQMAMLWGKFKPIATAEADARRKAGQEKGRQSQAVAREGGSGTTGPTSTSKPKPKRARTEVAQKLGVSERKLKAAAKVIEKAPELVAKVQNGEMTLKEATAALTKPEATQKTEEWTADEIDRREQLERGEATIANLRGDDRLIEWARDRNLFVQVDRRTDWGNPFVEGEDGTREVVCDLFAESYWKHKLGLQERAHEQLKGKLLGCWCYPKRCHAETLMEHLKKKTPGATTT